jgi:hypothetical protein
MPAARPQQIPHKPREPGGELYVRISSPATIRLTRSAQRTILYFCAPEAPARDDGSLMNSFYDKFDSNCRLNHDPKKIRRGRISRPRRSLSKQLS